MFKCYHRVSGASTNPKNFKKDNPINFVLVSLSRQACEKKSRSDFTSPWRKKGILL